MAGLYIHIPFCKARCAYCDFYSVPVKAEWLSQFEKALLWEAESIPDPAGWGTFTSIYLGGGTPSLLEPSFFDRLLDLLGKHFSLSSDCEVTIEANPGTIDRHKLSGYRRAGINRLSLGVQSMDECELALLGRIHRRRDVMEAAEAALAAGFCNLNLDLIYGIPGQTLDIWQRSLNEALSLSPQHISCYLLQMEDEVPLARRIHRGELEEAGEDTAADMYCCTIETLSGAGYEQYEISNFARPGMACRHNLNYWQTGDYLGLGPGAVSFKLYPDSTHPSGARRWMNTPDLEGYLNNMLDKGSPPRRELETLNRRDLAAEAIMMGLRRTRGIAVDEFLARFGVNPWQEWSTALEWGLANDLLQYDPPYLHLTCKGYFLSNQIFLRLL